MRLGTGNFRAERGRAVWQQRERAAAAFSGWAVGGPWEGTSQWFGELQRTEAGFDGSTKARRAPRRG